MTRAIIQEYRASPSTTQHNTANLRGGSNY